MVENYLRSKITTKMTEMSYCHKFDLRWNPESRLHLVTNSHVQNETVSQFKARLKETLNDVIYSHKLKKPDECAISIFKYKPHSCNPGDKFCVTINSCLFSYFPFHSLLSSFNYPIFFLILVRLRFSKIDLKSPKSAQKIESVP